MKQYLLITVFSMLILSCNTVVEKEIEISNTPVVIGSWNLDNGQTVSAFPGDLNNQQVWLDYIKAHNMRDLDKIAAMNAEDWEGYPPDGSVIKGTEAQIEFLDAWFKASSPKWKTRWMIANSGENEEGETAQWLTTGNDIRFLDENGNEVLENHVHDVEFVNGKIKKLYVYSKIPESVD